jgi:fumarylpyruvate hydrolase
MDYIFPPHVTSIPMTGGGRFPVRRVYCVGRNYADHAVEMGFDPRAEPPFFFCKATDNVVAAEGGAIELRYPMETANFHHEVELVVAIGRRGARIDPAEAAQHIFGYAIGLDMTRRDLQMKMRDAGRPWEIGKTLERGAPLSAIQPIERTGELNSGNIELLVDGVCKQKSDIAKLIWSIPEIIADLSRYYMLEPGDLVFTGTPEGVGPVVAGQTMLARIDGLGELEVKVVEGGMA